MSPSPPLRAAGRVAGHLRCSEPADRRERGPPGPRGRTRARTSRNSGTWARDTSAGRRGSVPWGSGREPATTAVPQPSGESSQLRWPSVSPHRDGSAVPRNHPTVTPRRMHGNAVGSARNHPLRVQVQARPTQGREKLPCRIPTAGGRRRRIGEAVGAKFNPLPFDGRHETNEDGKVAAPGAIALPSSSPACGFSRGVHRQTGVYPMSNDTSAINLACSRRRSAITASIAFLTARRSSLV